jgi:potassium efflux system protein
LGELASKRTTIEFKPSLRAALLTLVVALPWPLLMWSVGYLLNNPGIESEFTRSFAVGLRFAAALLFFAELLRQSYRSRGLADAHFEWPEACIAQVRRYLRLFPWTLLPVVLWIVGLEVQSTQPFWAASLGRLLFILVMVLLTLVLWRVLLSSASPLLQIIKRSASGFFMNLHRLWRPLLVALPLGLAGLAAAGYYYTAQQLAVRGIWTAAMIAGLMLVGGLLQRWVLLSRRKLAREQARQKRAAAQAAAAAAAEAALQAGEAPPSMSELPEETVDLGALSEQTRKLVNTSLQFVGVVAVFIIWRDVFPALLRLDSSPLPLVNTPNIDNPTTWGHLLRFVVASAVTFAAVRDLPSVLELAVLQQFSIDPGVRYAITALVRYALLGLGIIAAAAALGITATSISWLVAALGVGLGFGLQEIFANFVSGIILLFERPIRVGDIITLGDKTGIVTRIRIRATTIVDWDRKEYIVPNKDLVTERLLNWTLTDQTNRIVIEIGVAYGSDTELAVQTLRKICEDHPRVLADPGPVVTFEGFGDSTLNLVLRCFLASLEFRLQTIHELHTTIDREFRALNIEIAFPQRDIHVRSLPSTLLSPNSASASAAATTTSNAADNR